jgi:ligand-binding sensor domain-containing protein/signal transduction histidine kinase
MFNIFRIFLILFAFQSLIPGYCLSQSYQYRNYTSSDGILGYSVKSLHQDSRGFLWVGTENGLSRFDGNVFTHYQPGEALSGTVVDAIEEDKNGFIWVGTERGASRFDGESWIHFNRDNGLIVNGVLSILVDREENIWFATWRGICRFDGTEWMHYTETEHGGGNQVYSILEDKDGYLWFGTNQGISRFDGENWKNYPFGNESQGDRVTSILEDRDGNLWFGTNQGISRFDGENWKNYSFGKKSPGNRHSSILEDSRGSLWFASRYGIERFDGRSWHHISSDKNLSESRINAIVEDREGNLWFGTDIGLSKLPGYNLINLTVGDGLNDNDVTSIYEDPEGNYWFGMYEGGLNRFDGTDWRSYLYTKTGFNPGLLVRAILKDSRGVLWIATGSLGVYKFDGTKWENISTDKGLGSEIVTAMIQDSRGNLWFGTWRGGVSRFDGQHWKTFTKKDGLLSDKVNTILEDRNGVLWFGTYGGGVTRFNGESWSTFTTDDGLSDNFINTIFEDDNGNIWIGSEQKGITKYDGSGFRIYSIKDGLSSNSCYFILQEGNYLYFGTNNGVTRFDGTSFKVYTADDGLSSNNMNRNSCLKDSKGNLWFGSKNGVSKYDPGLDRSKSIEPPIYINKVFLLGNTSSLANGSELQYNENYLSFDYAGVSFTAPKNIKYSFILEGLDKEWQMSDSRSIQYPNLKSGSYTFKVKARNGEGLWSTAPAEFSFSIAPPYWGTLWFRILSIFLMAGIFYGVFKEWHRRKTAKELRDINTKLKDKNCQLEKEISEREKAEEQSKSLESQLLQAQKMESIGRLGGGVAHDFNNMLSPIIGYSELIRDSLDPQDPNYSLIEEIRKAGLRSRDLTRQLLAFSRKQALETRVINLNEVIIDMDSMLRRLLKESIELTFFLQPSLGNIKVDPSQLEQILLNLVVNANDAIAENGKITIETDSIDLDEKYAAEHFGACPGPHIMLAISDNGSGIDQENFNQIFEPFFTTKKQGKGTGLGLSTVYGIVKQHGGNIFVYSESGKGTTFKVYLPRVEESIRQRKAPDERKPGAHGPEKILVAEDEELIRNLVVYILEKYGYKVISAGNANEAIAIAAHQKSPIRLLLTDVVMPGKNGRELFRHLVRSIPGLKVLYMSGYTDNVIAHHGILEDGINFLQKPINEKSLLQKVRNALDN